MDEATLTWELALVRPAVVYASNPVSTFQSWKSYVVRKLVILSIMLWQ